jgi:hypothetical protein
MIRPTCRGQEATELMGRRTIERAFGLLATGALLIACSSAPGHSARDAADANDTGRTLAAKNDSERALLAALPTLRSGTAERVGDVTLVADAPYTAASGRICRSLHITKSKQRSAGDRLACSNGKDWFFVPDVFGTASGPE